MKNCPWFKDKTMLTFLFIIGWIAAPTTGIAYDYDSNSYYEYDDDVNEGMAEMDDVPEFIPSFISEPTSWDSKPGDSVRLPCIVDSLDGLVVVWKKDDNVITVGSQVINQDGRIKLEDDRNGNYLVISSVEESDAGEYRCQISTLNAILLTHYVNIRGTASCGIVNGEVRNVGDTWTEDCNNCVCRETGIATCTKRFCLNAPIISPPRDIPCLGCPQESEVDDDITAAADHATASLAGISDSGCGGIKLVKVENAKRQVVAGTNFFLTLRLQTREGLGCSDKTEKICENIVVFKPLPFACQSDDGCLELTSQEGISCKPVDPGTPSCGIVNGEERNVGDTWTDDCNNCVCRETGIATCTKRFCLNVPIISPPRAPQNIPQDDEKYARAANVSDLIAEKLVQHNNETFDLYVDASKNFAQMIDRGIPEDLLKYLVNPEEYKIVTKQSAISSSSSASTSTTAPPTIISERAFFFGPNGGRIRANPRYRVGNDFRVSMWIKPRSLTGLLLAVKGRRDYVVLEMVNGEFVFIVDNGRGPIISRLTTEINIGEWHKVEAVKAKNVVTVGVDNIFGEPGIGFPGVSSTDTNHPLFFGGHNRPASLMVADYRNYEGCIGDVSIENNDLVVTDDMLFGDITNLCPPSF